MNTRDSDIIQWIDDAAYLVEELKALKKVISAIPFDERPSQQQESMLDIIRKIGYMQEYRYSPVLNVPDNPPDKKSLQNIPELSEAEDILHFKEEAGRFEILDEIIVKRGELISSLRNCPDAFFSEVVAMPEGKITRIDIIREMVRFERIQFKKVAERVLTLDIENHSGKINSTN